MKKLYSLLFCFFLYGCASNNHTDDSLYMPDPQATAEAPWEVGEIVDSGEGIFGLQMYRAFMGVNSQGEYLIQAFYEETDIPYTSIIRFREKEDVTEPIFSYCSHSNIGSYIQYSPTGNKLVEGSCQNGKRIGIWYHYNLEGELEYKKKYTTPFK